MQCYVAAYAAYTTEGFIILILLLAYTVIAQSTAQGHLRPFQKFKFRTQFEYNTKHAHYINFKTYKRNPKGSPFGIALVKNGK